MTVFTITDPIAKILGNWASGLGLGAVLFRVALSLLLAAVLGYERAAKRHAAGLRTFIVVSLGGTLAILGDLFLLAGTGHGSFFFSAAVVVAAAMLSGNAVLYSSKNQIRGLTTSAALWVTAILGIAVGAGLYTAALIGFAALLCSLSLFPLLESYLKNRSNHFEIQLELTNRTDLVRFAATLRQLGLRVDDIEENQAYRNCGLSVYSIALTVCGEEIKKYKDHRQIIEALASIDYVHHVEELN